MHATRHTHLVGVLVATALGLLLTVTGSARAGTTPTWSLPIPTTQAPFQNHGTLTAVACADSGDCYAGAVGVSAAGVIYQSTDQGADWTLARASDDVGGGPFTCAPDSDGAAPFCLAISGTSIEDLSAPGAPVTGPSNDMPLLELATAVSCPSAGLCVAAGQSGSNGEIIASTEPLTGAWNATDADPGLPLVAISCPDTGLCAAVDASGGVVVSTDPGGGGTWARTQVATGLDSISCPSASLCVAVSSTGQAYASSSPATGAWAPVTIPGATDLASITCPSTGLCAISSPTGAVYASRTPAAGGFSQVAALAPGLSQLSCPTTTACEAVDASNVVSTPTVLAGTSSWQSTAVYAWNPLAAISCASGGLCVALGTNGSAVWSTTPLAGGGWSTGRADPTAEPTALSCPTTSACFGVDRGGGVLWSTAPSTDVWHRARIDRVGLPEAISCPTSRFCVTTDAGGYVFTSTDPVGGLHAWRRLRLEKPVKIRGLYDGPTAISCSGTRFCLVTDGDSRIFISHDPAAPRPVWTSTRIWKPLTVGHYSLNHVACPTSHDCVVTGVFTGSYTDAYHPDALGTYALTSTDPSGGARMWHARQIDGGYAESDASTDDAGIATGLSCPTVSFCAMVDDLGTGVTNIGAPSGPGWLSASVDALATPDASNGMHGMSGVSCFAAPAGAGGDRCVAIDGFGNRFIFGVGAGPVVPIHQVTFPG